VVLGTVSWLMFAGMVHAAEIKVLSTQATEEAYRELVPQFEKASGHKVTTVFTGTLAANKRLAAGETYDLLIMSAPSIEEHIKAGKVVPGSRVDLAKSGVGVGVKAGAPKPDISTTEALKKTVLAAKSIGYSTGPSGNYIIGLFQCLGKRKLDCALPHLLPKPYRRDYSAADCPISGALPTEFQRWRPTRQRTACSGPGVARARTSSGHSRDRPPPGANRHAPMRNPCRPRP